MNGRSVAAVALVLVVVFAGCGGTSQPAPETDTPTDAATPTATATPSVADVSMPSGVDGEGVADRDALMDGHGAALDGRPVTVDVDFRLTVDGDGQNVSLRGKVTPDDDRGWLRVRTPDGTGTYYTDGGATYERVEVDGSTRYGTTDEVSAVPQTTRFGADSRLRDALWNANWTFDGVVEEDGEYLLRYEATRVSLPDDVDVDREDASATSEGVLLVDEDGVVRHVDVGATVETDGETVEYGITVSFSDVGTTTIDRPDWVDHAEAGES